MSVVLLFFIFIFGVCIGSYLNVCIYRIPRDISTAAGRSFCTACNHRLVWYDLVPVLSYLCLKGRCRWCGSGISPRYLLVELFTGFCFLLSYVVFGISPDTLLACAVLSLLIPIAFIDAEFKVIPDRFNIIILALGFTRIFFSGDDWLSHVIGLFAVSVPFLIIALLTKGIGGGDIKLMAAAGLFLGWAGAILSVIIGSIFGSVYGVYLYSKKRAGRKTELPYGPFLALGIGIAVLFGKPIIDWYLTVFILRAF